MSGNETLVPAARRRFVKVDGIRTCYLECGEGPPVVLLHDGGWGASGETCWFRNVETLAEHYRVIAPDWLGFGGTDKLYDFGDGRGRRLGHMTRFFETLDIDEAAFLGTSMGATLLLQVVAWNEYPWPVAAIAAASGGGFIPLNEAREKTLSFEGTRETMREALAPVLDDEKWLERPEIVDARLAVANQPGAWEALAAARLRSPVAPAGHEFAFGKEDTTPYEQISVPTLLVAGANDQLKLEGYAEEVAKRIPDSEVHVLPDCGHFPQIEHAEAFNDIALRFLKGAYPPDA